MPCMTCILHLGIKLLLTLHHEIGRMWFSLPGINVQLDTEVSWDHVSIQLNRFRLGFEAPGNLGSLEAKEEKSGVGSHYLGDQVLSSQAGLSFLASANF